MKLGKFEAKEKKYMNEKCLSESYNRICNLYKE